MDSPVRCQISRYIRYIKRRETRYVIGENGICRNGSSFCKPAKMFQWEKGGEWGFRQGEREAPPLIKKFSDSKAFHVDSILGYGENGIIPVLTRFDPEITRL